MELKLEALNVDSLPQEMYMSVRVGEVQKMSRVVSGRLYKFPQSVIGDRKYGKIELFQRVGGCSVGIVPDATADQEVAVPLGETGNKAHFRILLEGDPSIKKMSAQPVVEGGDVAEEKQAATDANPKVVAAKAYLEKHNLEMRLHEAMQAVLREKPEDPGAFVAERLLKSSGVVTKLPKAGEAPAEASRLPGASDQSRDRAALDPTSSGSPGEFLSTHPSVGTWMTPSPRSLRQSQVAATGGSAFHIDAGAPAAVPAAAGCPWELRPSVGTWCSMRLPQSRDQADGAKSFVAMPMSSFIGPVFYSCNLSPTVRCF